MYHIINLHKNLKESYQLQPENGLFIKPYYAKRLDNELIKMIPFLERIANVI